MKNKRIIDSWNEIEPDSTADECMLDAILACNHSGKTEKGKVLIMTKIFNWKRLTPIAACLMLLVVVTTIVGNNSNWFRNNIYTETLNENEILSFYKSNDLEATSFDFGVDVKSRDLTVDENKAIFGNIGVTSSHGTFNSDDKSLLRVEAKVGNTKIILAAHGIPLADTVINADTEVSTISTVPVSTGYFNTNKNSEGISNIIYFASFTIDDISIYVELGGAEVESETIRVEIASVIETIIQNGAPDFSKVTE